MIIFALLAYALSMVAANLLVAHFGPVITPLLAFVLIGLDLTLRDWLQIRLRGWQMGALIFAAGALTYLVNPAAKTIAVASAVSFLLSALADWAVFSNVRGSWLKRSMSSNVVGAAVDSMTFPWLAFGAFMPGIILAQFAAKVAGGAIWAWMLSRANQKVAA